MKPNRIKFFYLIAAMLLICISLSVTNPAFARVGGAGGHSSGGGFSSHSGGSYHSYDSGGGGGTLSPGAIVIIIIFVVLYYIFKGKKKNAQNGNAVAPTPVSVVPFPPGLDAKKVATSFLSIQDAWQRKDLTNVRKWLSDGMYQRLTTQFKMMNILGQSNTLSNIRISNVVTSNTNTDNNYQTAEVAISFIMDDSFTSSKYQQFNESYQDDSDTEYWTFIKRNDSGNEKNLYDNNSCPNCGAPFEVKMGEISRCSNCNTLTNSAAYDWVLSEITQAAAYSGGAGLSDDMGLKELMKNDPFFAVQRMEDIASNVFMQIMEVYTIGDKKRITRFAIPEIAEGILKYRQQMNGIVFDRLFLENVTLTGYTVQDNIVRLRFELNATYRRVAINSDKLQMLDNDFITRPSTLELSRSQALIDKNNIAETVYSYECSTCGAPYTDTTEDHCTYCDAPVVDISKNWVLTGFTWQ